jgi:hypothetical protein
MIIDELSELKAGFHFIQWFLYCLINSHFTQLIMQKKSADQAGWISKKGKIFLQAGKDLQMTKLNKVNRRYEP